MVNCHEQCKTSFTLVKSINNTHTRLSPWHIGLFGIWKKNESLDMMFVLNTYSDVEMDVCNEVVFIICEFEKQQHYNYK